MSTEISHIISKEDLKLYSRILFFIELVIFASIYYLTKFAFEPFVIWDSILNLSAQIKVISFFSIIFFGGILHELIHAIFFAVFNKRGWKMIKFGVKIKLLALYCHCSEPISVKHYRIVAVMPLLFLVGITLILFLVTQYFWFILLSFLFCFTSSGDLILLFTLRKLSKETLIKDHHSEVGYIYIAD